MTASYRPRAFLVGTYGDDELIAQAAWISVDRTITQDKRERLESFLADLAAQGHHTPFEHSVLHFIVDCDIATHIHLLKHRIGVSINSESARYKELKEDKFLIPADWPVDWQAKLIEYTLEGQRLYHEAIKELEPCLGRKRAKESARYFLGYNSRIQSDVVLNWRSLAHLLSLRAAPHAQREVCSLAAQMLDLVAQEGKFSKTIAAFAKAGIFDEDYLLQQIATTKQRSGTNDE